MDLHENFLLVSIHINLAFKHMLFFLNLNKNYSPSYSHARNSDTCINKFCCCRWGDEGPRKHSQIGTEDSHLHQRNFNQKRVCNCSVLFATAHSAKQKGRGQHAAIKGVVVEKMPKNLSCGWSTRFMKVILLGLSLVRTSL